MIGVTAAAPSPWTAHASNVYSQFGEDGIIAEIFNRIGTTNKQCFEVGAADGKWFSNSRKLVNEGWRACLIEADEKNWPALDKLDDPPRVTVVHGRADPAGPNSLDSILALSQLNTQLDLGVIDVDGQDYYLWNGMMKFRPRVLVVEYDPFADPAFIPDLGGLGQAGLAAICSIAVSKGYFNCGTTQTNAFFVDNRYRDKFYDFPDTFANTSIAPNPPKPTPPAPPPAPPIENCNGIVETVKPPVIATGKEQEIKIAAILSRPRFGLNVFWDCASEALAPWHIPIRSFYGVFWGQCMETAMEEALNEGIDWILTLDYDSLFTSRHVQQLIDALGQDPKIDAIAALQCRRGRPLPLCVRADGTMELTGRPVQVRTAHFGLTIFRAEKLRKLKKPWFHAQPNASGNWGEGRLDEDIAFWGNWGDSGNSLYVHTGCKIGHIEEMVSEYNEQGKHQHVYLTEWRQRNGHQVKSFE